MNGKREIGSGAAKLPDRSPRRGRIPQELAAQLGDHILSITLVELERHGVDACGMDTIAAAAKVSKRTLYQRYGSKNSLILHAIEFAFQHYIEPVTAATLHGKTVREQLLRAANRLLDVSLQPKAAVVIDLAKWAMTHAPEIAVKIRQMTDEGPMHLFRTILEQGVARGEIIVDDLDFMTLFMLDTLVRIPRFRVVTTGDMSKSAKARRRYLDQSLDFLLQAMKKAPE